MDVKTQETLQQNEQNNGFPLFADQSQGSPAPQGTPTPQKPQLQKIKGHYPTKTSINLVYKEKKAGKNFTALALFGVFLVLLAIFTKFMVLDQIAAVNDAEYLYHTRQDQLATLQRSNSVYDQVEAEYSHFGIGYLSQAELDRHDRVNMLDVIDDKVGISKGIRTIQISENTAVLSFLTLELKDMATIISRLEESEYVSYVTASRAATENYTVTYVDQFGTRIADVDDETREAVTNYISVVFKTPAAVKAAQAAAEGGERQ